MEGRAITSMKDSELGVVFKRLTQAKKAKGEFSSTRMLHTCSKFFCNPETEVDLKIDFPISSNVYMCKYGSAHVCSETTCDEYACTNNQTCPITGIQHGGTVSSYDKNDYRTWRSKPQPDVAPPAEKEAEVKKVKKRKVPDPNTIRKQISDKVTLMFYSNSRHSVNQAHLAKKHSIGKKAIQTYVDMRRTNDRQMAFSCDLYYHAQRPFMFPAPLKELVLSSYMVDYLTEICYQVFTMCQSHAERSKVLQKLDIDKIALGTLYCLKEGIQKYLPKDEFVAANLPEPKYLEYFGISRSKVSDGISFVKSMYANSTEDDLHIKLDTLPTKKAMAQAYKKLNKKRKV